jgi:hypothetical protein
MADDDLSQLQNIQLRFSAKFGTFSDDERKAIVDALRTSHLGEVRLDEAIVSNLGIGGPGGLPITIDVWLNIWEGTAAALLAVAITKGIAPVVKIVQKRLARLVAVVHKDESEPVTYIADPPEVLNALDAMPADYEITIRTESRTRVWRHGRWEHYESTTRTERGGPGK